MEYSEMVIGITPCCSQQKSSLFIDILYFLFHLISLLACITWNARLKSFLLLQVWCCSKANRVGMPKACSHQIRRCQILELSLIYKNTRISFPFDIKWQEIFPVQLDNSQWTRIHPVWTFLKNFEKISKAPPWIFFQWKIFKNGSIPIIFIK